MRNGTRFLSLVVTIAIALMLFPACFGESDAYRVSERAQTVMPTLTAFTEYREIRMTIRHESENKYTAEDVRSLSHRATLKAGVFRATDAHDKYEIYAESDGVTAEFLPPVLDRTAVAESSLMRRDGYQEITLIVDTASLLAYYAPLIAPLFTAFGLPENTVITDALDTTYKANVDRSQGYFKTASLVFSGNVPYNGVICPIEIQITFDYTDVSYPV